MSEHKPAYLDQCTRQNGCPALGEEFEAAVERYQAGIEHVVVRRVRGY